MYVQRLAVALGQIEKQIQERAGSRSMAQGSSPPSTSAPAASARSSSSAVPGRISSPDCGNATIWMSTRPASASRVASTPSRCRRPASVSTSTWVRMRVVPSRRKASAKACECTWASWPLAARQSRSLSMRSVSAEPTSLTYQDDPQVVLSRWAWPSTRPGSSKAPPPSSTGNARHSGAKPTFSPGPRYGLPDRDVHAPSIRRPDILQQQIGHGNIRRRHAPPASRIRPEAVRSRRSARPGGPCRPRLRASGGNRCP